MHAVYQTRNGRGGDCLRAALASVLELSLDDVPDIMAEPDAMTTWPLRLGAWLSGRGLEAIPVAPHSDLPAVLAHMGAHYPGECYLLAGRVGDIDHGHVVVGRGAQIVHDPSPEPAVLVGGVPPLGGRYLALLIRPMAAPVLPAPVDFSPLERHERVGLAFSGGKDSLALWHLLAPHHHRLTVYHVDTGDRLPEAEAIVRQYEARTLAPFVRIKTNSRVWREEHGLPSDLVPVSCTPSGLAMLHGEAGDRPIVSRHECCFANRSLPAAERIRADGITLVIQGTRRADGGYGSLVHSDKSGPSPHPNSFMIGGQERWLPIADWTGDDVVNYLKSVGAPVAGYYQGKAATWSAPVECMHCPATTDTAFLRYLREHHPDVAASVAADQKALRAEIVRPLARLQDSLGALGG